MTKSIKINLKKAESVADQIKKATTYESGEVREFVNAGALKCAEAAEKLYMSMMKTAVEIFNVKHAQKKIVAEPECYTSEETGNKYFRIHMYNKHGIVMSTIKVASWNVNGGYLYTEMYTGNAAVLLNKLNKRHNWIAFNEKFRFDVKTDEAMKATAKPASPFGNLEDIFAC